MTEPKRLKLRLVDGAMLHNGVSYNAYTITHAETEFDLTNLTFIGKPILFRT
jgi:hypothetical protein